MDGKEKRVMVENTELKDKFIEWAKGLDENSEAIQIARRYYEERNYNHQRSIEFSFRNLCVQELGKLGFSRESISPMLSDLMGELIYWNKDTPLEKFQDIINRSSAKYKRPENTIPAKDYWEKFFSENPGLRPKHVVYYDGDPTDAIYRLQQENGIGSADTSKVEAQLLGFDDHHIIDVRSDPRANKGHTELVELGNKIIKEHFAFK